MTNPTTPYFVIHKDELDCNFEKLTYALKKYWPNSIVGYSYKTNSLPWVINHFKELGCYAEVVSNDEYSLAKYANVASNKIIYNGPIKAKESFLDALENGAIVNIDSQREIDWLEDLPLGKRNVGIRVNFDIEKLCPGESQCGDEGGRFGFCYENGELEKVIKKLKDKKASVIGLHLHTSSKTRSVNIYKAIATVACRIKNEYDLELVFLDIGGGFFGGLSNKPQFDEYLQSMEQILISSFDKEVTKLIVEPGMSVIGAPISYVTTVIDVKDTNYGRFVITDGSRTAVDPLMTKKSYFYEIENSHEKGSIFKKQVICGFTCMEHDRMFELLDQPVLSVGDKICYNKVGAYTMCLSPLFIRYFPDVYIEETDGTLKCVRKAWTVKDYIQESSFEV